MKYKCLILDHDDTVVNSTATIHYPSFIEYLKVRRPHTVSNYTLESFISKNFTPGIVSLFRDELGMSDEEMAEEQKFWERFVNTRVPVAYGGIAEIIAEMRSRGGIIAVASHSMGEFIKRDYSENGLSLPDEIYGWELPREKRKPATFAVDELISKYGFDRKEILMVDDLKPGFDMARAAGIDFAAAGWAYDVPEISDFMRRHSDYYLSEVSELYKLLFD
ncbi:MAG: HAD family hydrolase [Ruminococcaceae bacterium]|nr:HAD family hydrolase [Oscillospiraceae bacterium]